MLVIRPILLKDLDDLLALLEHAGHGLTSLPRDADVLKKRISLSMRSFEYIEKDRPGGELYLFVMEDIFKGKIIGVSGILSKIGGFDPFYFYRQEKQRMASGTIDVEHELNTLHVEKIYDGPAEICSLYLSPDYRSSQNGRFLSLSRFLYMANHLAFFENEVIAEMRGRVDKLGHSPFWEAVGKKFFKIDFPEADYLTMKNKKFIEELLPNYPIIVDLLPQQAQRVVGKVHPNTVPALKILNQEGFEECGLVGIFESGPVVKAKIEDIRTIKRSKVSTISEIKEDNQFENNEKFIISLIDPLNFKCCLSPIKMTKENEIAISTVAATALKLKIGDQVRHVNLKD